MNTQRQVLKNESIPEDYRNFCSNLFIHIWSQHRFSNLFLEKKFIDEYKYFVINEVRESGYYTENIYKAIHVTMFILRDFIRCLFASISKVHFKQEVKVFWTRLLKVKNDIFLKTLYTLAIIAEAFLQPYFCIESESSMVEEATQYFMEHYIETLEFDFMKNGGWRKFDAMCFTFYSDLFAKLDELSSLAGSIETIKYYDHNMYRKLIRKLKKSPIGLYYYRYVVFAAKACLIQN